MSLSSEDRDLIEVSTALFGWGTQADALEAVTKAVEQIVARNVTAALNDAVAAIEAGVLPSHPNVGYLDGFHRAALIVRDLNTTT